MRPDKIKYELVPTKEDLPTIIISLNNRRIPLHSKFYPSRESLNHKADFIPDKYDVIIVLGVGLGYHLVPLSENIGSYTRIVLVDAVAGIEKEIYQNSATSFLTESDIVTFITGQSVEVIERILSEVMNIDDIKGINVLEHSPSIRLFGEYYGEVRKTIEKVINKKAGIKATKKAFGSLYLRNILKNLDFIGTFKAVKDFFNLFSSYPAVVITSGPSIEHYLELIKEHHQKFFIIAVDSAFPVLSKFKIKPDFVVSIDPQPYIIEHFIDSDITDTALVFSISSNSLLVEKCSGTAGFDPKLNGILSLNSHPVSQLISELFPNTIGSIDSLTGSVAGDAVNYAVKLGFNPVGLIGFDFSFPDHIIYSRGTAYQKRYSLFFQERFSTIEKLNFDYIMKSSKGYIHSGKFTRRSFIQYKESLEDFIQSNGIDNIFNINDTGIPIDGIPRATFNEYLERGEADGINKKAVLREIAAGSRDLMSSISLSFLRNTLCKKDIFDELLEASLEDSANSNKKNKFKRLISRAL